ncbi:MAG: DUF5615 family PIN-like protein [Acidobacteria bacterium]|nr:DUF5615 family PIN-like protein [Acidobacteriota bacterium]
MKLLFDQNLSFRLTARLENLFPGSEHVRSAGLASADDAIIWEYARQHGFAIVSKDSGPPAIVCDRFAVNTSWPSSATAERTDSGLASHVMCGPRIAGISCDSGVHLIASH